MTERRRTWWHEKSVEQIVRKIQAGENDFRALVPGYRAAEAVRRIVTDNRVPRRHERSAIYREAEQRLLDLGESAVFAVVLLWASRDDYLSAEEKASIRISFESPLVHPGFAFGEIDYHDGEKCHTSYVDRVLVTHREGRRTQAYLDQYNTRMTRYFSLVHPPTDDTPSDATC